MPKPYDITAPLEGDAAQKINENFDAAFAAIDAISDDLPVVNGDTVVLAKGTPVYGSTGDGAAVVVLRADADANATMEAIGLVVADIPVGGAGTIRESGPLDLDTSLWNVGDILYVSTTAGELTATTPSGAGDVVQRAAIVVADSATAGRLFITLGPTASAHNLLSAAHGDTTAAAGVRGDLIRRGATAWERLAITATAGRFVRSDGTDVGWSTLALPNAATTGDLLYASASNTLAMLADVATGNALISGGVGFAPSWGKIQIGSGTNHINGTLQVINGGTGLAGGVAQGDLVYGSAANVFSLLLKNATATRYLSNTGASNDPAWAQVNLTNGVTATLPYANGGTNATTAWTAGSVMFAGASAFAQDNANLFWNDSLNRLDVNTLALHGGSGVTDVILVRDTTDSLGLRNGTTAQAFNIYGTFTSGTNYERLAYFVSGTAGGVLQMQAGSGGGTLRALRLSASSLIFATASTDTIRFSITSAGHFHPETDNAVDVGSTNSAVAGRIRDVGVARTITIGADNALPTTGTGVIIFGDGTAPTGLALNTAGLYANDDVGTVKMYAINEAGSAALLNYRNIALGGGVAPTLGTIGGSGPTVAAQNSWLEFNVGGTAYWVPAWI